MKKLLISLCCVISIIFFNSYSYGEKKFTEEQVQNIINQAEQGDANAQFKLGYMYFLGKEVIHNYHEAFKWFIKSAEQGNDKSQYYVGNMYNFGKGVRQDYHEAFKWYKKSAEQGNIFAQRILGIKYEHGDGVRQDKSIAKEWYGKVCDNGEQQGCIDYRRLNEAGF